MADKNQPDEFGITDPGQAAAGMPVEPPKLTSPDEVKALAPGTEFIDPTGKKRVKPYDLKGLEQAKWSEALRAVPDGAPFIDPQGNAREKPTYEPLDFGDQILVDMSRGNERQIEAILRGQYGDDAVKKEPITGELYVERDGKKLKPNKGGLLRRGAAATVSGAAPSTGMIGGSMVGGVAGVPTGPGAVLTGMAGAGLGAAGGEAFNQAILALAGYSSSPGEYAANVGKEAAFSAAGVPAGHVLGKVASGLTTAGKAAAATVGEGGNWLAGTVGRILGATPETVESGARLSAGGAKPRPSQHLLEAPYLSKLVETFDPAFRKKAGGVDVLEHSAAAYYDEKAPELMAKMGIPAPAGRLTQATAPVAVEPFGANMIAAATARKTAADAKLDGAIAAARQAVINKAADPAAVQATQSALRAAQAEATAAAQSVVDNGFKSIQADVDNSIKLVNAGENPGDMDRLWSEKITALRQAVGAQAKKLYDVVKDVSGGVKPNVAGLKDTAEAFLAEVPEEFKDRYPGIIRSIANLKSEPDYGQVAQLRSMLRQDIDFNDLTPGVKQGALKHFVGQINEVLFDKGAPPELQEAATALRTADDFYSANIKKFKAESMQWVIKQLEAGVPQDAKALAEKFLQPNQTEEIRMLKEVGGKPLWAAVQAADTQTMLDGAKTLVPGEVDGLAFARQVLERDQNGILGAAYDKETAAKLLTQARQVMLLEGKLPMDAMPGDTVQTLMRRAAAIGDEIKKEAAADPLKVLKREMDRFNTATKIIGKEQRAAELKNPLRFLTAETSVGAIQAAETILKSPDKIIAVARQFGENSPEFEMMRQVYVTRLFQRGIGATGHLANDFATKITPEVQALMFPGETLEGAQQLAKDMALLMPANAPDTGGSMAVASRVLNPLTSSPNFIAKTIGHLPGADFLARQWLGFFYRTISEGVTHPVFYRWLKSGLRGGPAAEDAAVRAWRAKYFPMAGRAAGAEIGGIIGEPDEPQPAAPVPLTKQAVKPWQEIYREKYGRL